MPPVPCIFYAEGRCRNGNSCQCRFLHQPAPPKPQLAPVPILPFASTAPPARRLDDFSQLIESINSLRIEAGEEDLQKNNQFFSILRAFVCSNDEDSMEEVTDVLQAYLPDDWNEQQSERGSEHEGYSDDDDDGFGDMDLFSPLKKSTPRYREPTFSTRQTARYERNSYSLNSDPRREHFDLSLLVDNPSAVNIQFGVNFSIQDQASILPHFACTPTPAAESNAFPQAIQAPGNGGGVQDEARFTAFVRMCSSIRVFRLEAFTSLSDQTLLAIFEACPQIELIQLTGHDKSHGKVKGSALKKLARTPAWAPNLKALYLLDQGHGMNAAVKELSAARPKLWIHTGETLGESMSAQIVASMDGGADSYTWLGGKIVSFDNDSGLLPPMRRDDDVPW
ncbi:hypothetical protein FB45DRAFT_1118874 [Roridomyces roridus]|uniref:C3H1-type domain-containing protein n=1 Tax=Roridomyces roridus TaxID=1738132 RepID=A0AAD7FCB6_9AGAR|nr:hypothetical protein FB45DRAFT_1118874 [Roridomyces roridus]